METITEAREALARFAPAAPSGELCGMRPHFLAFRRTLPGGMIVLVSLEIDNEGVVHGRLQVERRLDPARQLFDTAPVVARATGRSKDEVLKRLRELAENDAELSAELSRWEAAHPSSRPPGQSYRP
jgi:hypothetical protein